VAGFNMQQKEKSHNPKARERNAKMKQGYALFEHKRSVLDG